ncbi:MAG: metallophosphoesterase [Deltaproteobacteria bacterium]|jgi:calcineurin-like phosphoesterase family protein|nr:metallophosphoesterase [Deltaproteobacteria bacterium]
MLITGDTFVISDTHFGDYDSIANGFDKYLVDVWNKTVSESDTVLHLGDFTSDEDILSMEQKIKRYSRIINGHIILIKGNHDVACPIIYESNGIELLDDVIIDQSGMAVDKGIISAVIGSFNGIKVLFSHYPVIDLYGETCSSQEKSAQDAFSGEILYLKNFFDRNKCDINVHGHIHEKINRYDNLIDVSPDNIGYRPLRLGELLSKTRQDKK